MKRQPLCCFWVVVSSLSCCHSSASRPRLQGAAAYLTGRNISHTAKQQSSKLSARKETPSAETTTTPVRRFYQAFDARVIGPRIRHANGISKFREGPCMCVSLQELEHDPSVRKQVAEQGGWCLIRLGDNEEGDCSNNTPLDPLWRCLETIDFQSSNNNNNGAQDSNDKLNLYLRRQTLSSSSSSTGGFDYLDLSLANDSLESLPQEIRNTFVLLGDIAARFTAAMAGIPNLDSLLHSETASHSSALSSSKRHGYLYEGSSMRLSRYIHDTRTQENLRSHCDWTFCTVVPVSSMAGLEVFTGSEWVRPEALVLGNNKHDHARYVVVLTGKWLEILGGGRVSSTVHRVTRAAGRPSAPFLLRPRLQFMDNDVETIALENPENVASSASSVEAFLREY